MSKKIVDENGNTYVQKKPFYKRVWFWIVIVVLVLIIGGSIGGGNKNKPVNKESNSKVSSNKKIITSEQFNNLKVGDMSNNGNGGTSYKDVESIFGKPNSTTSSSIQGQTVEMDTWSNLGGDYTTMSLSFGGEGDKRSLSSKSLTSAKSIISGAKISQADYDAITTNGTMNVSDLVKKFGQPAVKTVYSILNTETKTLVWSNVNSNLGSGVSLTVSGGNTVIGKTKTSN
ncbi:DUF3862 domain-containing protein [Periweissella ghanensis]|uniref:DUF3862 domain-containing protein n=1 Tax=Periweissella ghanensis TaxID=467997 RepID=A0ABM8ZC45_9LACO|nr:DUF3862 domain-containing protein [Periweissella ghanensis]MCM0600089.1 DUF3862 domain-containing protein [Periweissella ghanensis]CAH0418953.1 hypothetical protein WGH24286_01396 [Periweissella ghanensis]